MEGVKPSWTRLFCVAGNLPFDTRFWLQGVALEVWRWLAAATDVRLAVTLLSCSRDTV